MLALTAATVIGVSRAAGLAYRPKPLAAEPAVVASRDHHVTVFGNSLFEAAIDPRRLAAQLDGPTATAGTTMFAGGGWDAMHYYMLALLARDTLRPGRDAVIIDVSMVSLNDAESRFLSVRPEAATAVAAVPGTPVEIRLDVLFGAVSPLYRYRMAIRQVMNGFVGQRLERLQGSLERLSVVGRPRRILPYQVVTEPDRNFVIKEVTGDQVAFARAAREKALRAAHNLEVGGYKLAALTRAVGVLRARGIAVVLVSTPASGWYEALFEGRPALHRQIEQIAADSGAIHLHRWPPALHDSGRFWDGHHMVASATADFTDELARQLREALRW